MRLKMSVFYKFEVDGKVQFLSIEEARSLNRPDVEARIREIGENLKNKRMTKDGFTPGWQENIGAYAGGRLEYDRMLKERGLVEIGREYKPSESTTVSNPCATEEFANYAKELGVELSDNEVDAIKTGEYFSEDKVDLGE